MFNRRYVPQGDLVQRYGIDTREGIVPRAGKPGPTLPWERVPAKPNTPRPDRELWPWYQTSNG